MTTHLNKVLERIAAILNTGAKTYPATNRHPDVIMDEIEDKLLTWAPVGIKSGLKLMSFDGRNGAGACTATGLAIGDKVMSVVGLTDDVSGNQADKFEATITVADQIQQSSATDLSTKDYLALVFHQIT